MSPLCLFVSALESQIQALYDATAIATAAVNARRNTIATRWHDIPSRIREVADHRVHWGAAVTLAVVQTLSGNDLQTLHLIFSEGEVRDDFEELVDNLDDIPTIIGEEVNVHNVINNVFLDDE